MNPDRRRPTTTVRLLTPVGAGAVGVLLVEGFDALTIVDRAFLPARGGPLTATPHGRLRFGKIGGPEGEEVVAVILPGDPPAVEIQGHGGRAILDFVRSELIRAGATATEGPSPRPRRSTSADALDALPDAPTLRVAAILLDQARGALDRESERIAGMIGRDEPLAIGALDRLRGRAKLGLALRRGWRVAIAGRPNVGKSRLLNAIAGFDRAIVAAEPGTTRDPVALRASFDGWPVEVIDTAGIREAADPVERAGVGLARGVHDEADLIVLVLDRAEPLQDEDRDQLRRHPDALRVANKADRPAAWDAGAMGALTLSARTGAGLDALIDAAARRLVPEPPEAGEPVPFAESHRRRLDAARRALSRGESARAARLLSAWAGRPTEGRRPIQ